MTRILLALLLSSSPVFAQGAAGHWEGAIAAPMGDVLIELDLTSDTRGTSPGPSATLASAAGLGAYAGVVNRARTEMSGTLTSGKVTASLTLTRSGAEDGR